MPASGPVEVGGDAGPGGLGGLGGSVYGIGVRHTHNIRTHIHKHIHGDARIEITELVNRFSISNNNDHGHDDDDDRNDDDESRIFSLVRSIRPVHAGNFIIRRRGRKKPA